MLDNNKCVLVFNLSEDEVKQLKMANLKVIVITNEMASMKIGDIIGGFEILKYDVRLPNEKIILFNNFEEAELRNTIAKVRELTKEGMLAVVTPTSINWPFIELVSHLIEEREWMKRR